MHTGYLLSNINMDSNVGFHPLELIDVMRARIAEQPHMFITTLDNYESLKNSELNYNTSSATHNSQKQVKLVTQQNSHETLRSTPQKTMICRKCYSFISELQYENHTSICKKWKCNICLRIFKSKIDLSTHINTVHVLFKCNLCLNKKFPTAADFQKHLKETHNESEIYKCPSCDKLIGSLLLFKNHIDIHSDILQCGFCHVKYACRKSLKKHLKKHKQEDTVVHVENEIIKISKPVIIDYAKYIVNFKKSDTYNEETSEKIVNGQNNTNEEISKNEVVNVKKTTCALNELLDRGPLENASVSNPQKTDAQLEMAIENVMDNDINKQNTPSCRKLLKNLLNSSVYKVPQKE